MAGWDKYIRGLCGAEDIERVRLSYRLKGDLHVARQVHHPAGVAVCDGAPNSLFPGTQVTAGSQHR